MTQPAIVQTKNPATGVGSAVTAQFTSSITATNSAIVYAIVAVPEGITPVISSVQLQLLTGDGGSNSGSPINTTGILTIPWRWEARKEIGFFRADNLAAGFYDIVVNTGSASANVTVGGFEVSDAGDNIQTYVTGSNDTDSVASTISVGPVPSSGTLTATDGLAFFIHSSGDGNGTISYTTPSTWTARGSQTSGASGLMTVAAFSKALSANTALTAVGTPSADSLYGMAAIMLILDPVVGGGGTSKYVKVTNDDDSPDGTGSIIVDVHLPATTGKKGYRIFTASAQSWATIESGKSVMKIPVPSSGSWEVTGITLDVDDTVIVTGGASDSSHGFVDQAVGVIIEE
jgi:hypothetical protein